MIEFQGVSKVFDDGTRAVDDFTLVLPSHKTTVFVGSSGSGKTTLLRMINRMVDPTGGRILIDGEDIARLDPVRLRRRIGYVLQAAGLLPHRTVVDNIATVPRLNGVPRAQARAAARELLGTVGLEESLAMRYPNQLSGGSSSALESRVLSPPTPTCSSWTNPSGPLTQSCAQNCSRSSTGCSANSARRSCS